MSVPSPAPRLWPTHVLLMGLGLVYALVRYVMLGSTPPSAIPLFIVNKAVCVHATGALWLVVRAKRQGDQRLAARWWGALQAAVMLHVVSSVLVLQPTYLAKLFANGRFTLQGEISLLAGALAAGLWVNAHVRKAVGVERAFRLGGWLVVAHLLPLGLPGWFRPETWPGWLPPITLLCAVVTAVSLWMPSRLDKARNA